MCDLLDLRSAMNLRFVNERQMIAVVVLMVVVVVISMSGKKYLAMVLPKYRLWHRSNSLLLSTIIGPTECHHLRSYIVHLHMVTLVMFVFDINLMFLVLVFASVFVVFCWCCC